MTSLRCRPLYTNDAIYIPIHCWDHAIINAVGVQRWDVNARSNDLLIDNDVDLARRLWSRVEEFMPPMLDDRPVRGFNERFQYYRYAPGQRFAWHFDGHIKGPYGEESFLTLMIYLNEGYEGGETQFESVSVAGKLGMALVFDHDLLHFVATCWQRCKDHYHFLWRRQPTDHDGGSGKEMLRSMRELVERIAPLAIAENIFPWNSHSHARMVLRKGEPSQDKRLVHVWCARRERHVAIEWYKDGRSVMLTVKAMDSARWQRVVNWLD